MSLRGKLPSLKDKYYGVKPEVLKAEKPTPKKVEGKVKVKKDKKKK